MASSAPHGVGPWRAGSAPISLDSMESMPVGMTHGRYRVVLQGIDYDTLAADPALLARVILAQEKEILAWLPAFVRDHTSLDNMVTEIFRGSLMLWTAVELRAEDALGLKQVPLSLQQLSSAVAEAVANIPGIASAAVGEISACESQWNTDVDELSEAACTDGFPATTDTTKAPATTQPPEPEPDADSLPNPDCEYGWCGASCNVAAANVAWTPDEGPQRRPGEYEAAALSTPIKWRDVCGGGEMMSRQPNTYDCSARGERVEEVVVDGAAQTFFEFSGSVPGSGQALCAGLAYSCAGPSQTTEAFTAVKGSGLTFSFRAEAGSDYYEALVVALRCTNDACASDEDFEVEEVVSFERGNSMTEYADISYIFQSSGSKKLRFHLGSYDFTGGSALGALMYVRPFAYCGR